MELPRNLLRAKMAKGPTRGLFVALPDSVCAEIVALSGADWAVIDAEHGPFELPTIQRYLQVLAPYDIAPIVRPPEGSTVLIKRLLDIGAQSLLIPMVETAEQAARLVSAMRYPPTGTRGVGAAHARASRWSAVPDYLARAREELCLIVQVESAAALAHVEAIAVLDGVDGVFVGPADLSASMGRSGPDHPDVNAAICDALQKTRKAGKFAGVMAMNSRLRAQWVDAGANFVGVGVDTLALVHATRALFE